MRISWKPALRRSPFAERNSLLRRVSSDVVMHPEFVASICRTYSSRRSTGSYEGPFPSALFLSKLERFCLSSATQGANASIAHFGQIHFTLLTCLATLTLFHNNAQQHDEQQQASPHVAQRNYTMQQAQARFLCNHDQRPRHASRCSNMSGKLAHQGDHHGPGPITPQDGSTSASDRSHVVQQALRVAGHDVYQ